MQKEQGQCRHLSLNLEIRHSKIRTWDMYARPGLTPPHGSRTDFFKKSFLSTLCLLGLLNTDIAVSADLCKNGICYWTSTEVGLATSWVEARDFCSKNQRHLARFYRTVDYKDVYLWLRSTAQHSHWFDLNSIATATVYQYSDGSYPGIDHWNLGDPDLSTSAGVVIDPDMLQKDSWLDMELTSSHYFLCTGPISDSYTTDKFTTVLTEMTTVGKDFQTSHSSSAAKSTMTSTETKSAGHESSFSRMQLNADTSESHLMTTDMAVTSARTHPTDLPMGNATSMRLLPVTLAASARHSQIQSTQKALRKTTVATETYGDVTPASEIQYEWSPWTSCSVTCNAGSRARHKICDIRQKPGCQNASSYIINDSLRILTDIGECFEQPCPAKWSPWQPWSICTATCGTGTQQRWRRNENEAAKECNDYHWQTAYCNVSVICVVKATRQVALHTSSFTEADGRPSAKAVGSLGIGIVVGAGALCLVLDLCSVGRRAPQTHRILNKLT